MEAYNKFSLTHYAATVCKLMGIEAPACADEPLDWACDILSDLCKEGFDRVLIHNPDAVGMWLYQAYPDAFEPVLKHTQLTVPFKTVMPSVTPVCFGTMYTGAEPAVHGIQSYTKPVIKIDTFFDAVLRAGKKVAILATHGYEGAYATDPFEMGVQRLCKHSNLEYLGLYSVQDEDNLASFQTADAVAGAKAFARKCMERK